LIFPEQAVLAAALHGRLAVAAGNLTLVAQRRPQTSGRQVVADPDSESFAGKNLKKYSINNIMNFIEFYI
jgi:hypothetical protein